MKDVVLYLAVATLGVAVYHLGQKTIAPSANPMALLMAVYAVAFLLAAAALPLFRTPGQATLPRDLLSWPVLVVGLGVLLIEGGFLLAYRSGGALQWSNVAVNGVAALVLLPVAVLVFGERLSAVRIVGILLTLSGLALIAKR